MQVTRQGANPWIKDPSSQIDNARLDGLNHTAKALLNVGFTKTQLLSTMSDHIAVVERDTRRKVKFKDGSLDDLWFVFTTKRESDDFIRVVKPNEVRFLSAKISGVLVSANLMKPNHYNFDNSVVAIALRRLADHIEATPIRLADRDIDLRLE